MKIEYNGSEFVITTLGKIITFETKGQAIGYIIDNL